MINTRLINTVRTSKKYIFLNVVFQFISLILNIVLMTAIAKLFQKVYENNFSASDITNIVLLLFVCIIFRIIFQILSTKMSYLSSREVKYTLRPMIFNKLFEIGSSYKENLKTSEVVQLAVEGVEQLEIYFSQYLPQFVYAILAPLILFIYVSFIDFKTALVLLVCVPLIPISIAFVQTIAKKLLSKYWGQYTKLGDTFLENLQGLTTLKIYQSDEYKHNEMNEEAEKFRKITMKVLYMQLNSITIMDLVSFVGAAIGVFMAANAYKLGRISLGEGLLIILLSADFFIPMRLLGSFFHIAMNGISASEKMFSIINTQTDDNAHITEFINDDIYIENLSFGYEENRTVLNNLNIKFEKDKFTAIVGESGSGKSTIASLLLKKYKKYDGEIKIGNTKISDITERALLDNITYVGHNSYIFEGTVRENLAMAKKDATDSEMWTALEKTKIAEFFKSEEGLDTKIKEKASNLSGGQSQRLSIARALLNDTPIYIFDEATSNIDVESENDIMSLIYELSKSKTIILISHRLVNVEKSDYIYVIEKGSLKEQGTHTDLLDNGKVYKRLWSVQKDLESYTGAKNEQKK